MEFTFNIPFDKIESPPMAKDPLTKKWYMPLIAAFSAEQYAMLGEQIEQVLGEDFISFQVLERPYEQVVRITYEGHLDGDVEVRRESEMDPIINAWIYEHTGGQG